MNKILVILFLISFSIGIISLFLEPTIWWDEGIYASLGWNLKSNPFDYSFTKFGDYIPDTWEQAGFRGPLLPYIISLIYSIFGWNNFIVELLIPFFGALGVVVLYIFTKKIFNEKIALYSSIFLIGLPLYTYFSGKILTDVFVTVLFIISILFFWMGFEKNKNKYKILCGVFTGLTILARYTGIFLPLIYLIYLLFRDRNLKFLKDKWLWISLLSMFIILVPWFLYSYNAYGTPLGSLLHAKRASTYWGGLQPWYFFFIQSFEMFSIIPLIFLIGLFYIFKEKIDNKNRLILIWIIVILGFSMFGLEHKETRYLLPLSPAFCIVAGIGIDNLKKYKKLIFTLSVILVVGTLVFGFYNIFNREFSNEKINIRSCFFEGIDYLKGTNENSIVFVDLSPVVYYYSHREIRFIEDVDVILSIEDRDVYYFWQELDRPTDIRNALGTDNFEIVFRCSKDENLSYIYKLIN